MTTVTRRIGVALGLVVVLMVSACGGGDGGGGDENRITVWTAETLPDRVAAFEAIVARFTQQTGIQVEHVPVDEDQFSQLLTSTAAAGELPDVIGSIPLSSVNTLATNDLTNTDANQAVIDALGPETWNPRALELTREGDRQLAVPGEAWSQLLYYRKDWFDAAGLPAPTSYDAILNAARALHSPQRVGFVGATAPGDAFTQQTFEHIALANGCEMVSGAGEITIDSPQCVAAFAFYRDLIGNYSQPGAQDVDTVRAAYFAGQSAMAIWSTFLLDELAGLRNDAKPSCPECAADPRFLSNNTGIVAALQGPDGAQPAQFGEVISWTITSDAATDPAQRFVQFMVSGDGYIDWMAIAPEGKYPARMGSSPGATDIVDRWEALPVGVDAKAPLEQLYPQEVLDVLQTGPEKFSRWGFPQGQGELIGASLGELPVPAAVAALTTGATDPQGAAQQAAEALRRIQDTLR
jgi:multiple sugar transport system substrate-binding protein